MEFQTDDFLNEIQNSFGTSKYDAYLYSSLVQAYIGDAVYELVIRTILVDYQNEKVKNLHKKASSIVKAESQAKLIRSILSELSEEEMSIFRRGKNAKSATMAKNASAYDYHYATGFEAVIGYLYLNHNMSRALKLIQSGLDKMECYQEFDKKDWFRKFDVKEYFGKPDTKGCFGKLVVRCYRKLDKSMIQRDAIESLIRADALESLIQRDALESLIRGDA